MNSNQRQKVVQMARTGPQKKPFDQYLTLGNERLLNLVSELFIPLLEQAVEVNGEEQTLEEEQPLGEGNNFFFV